MCAIVIHTSEGSPHREVRSETKTPQAKAGVFLWIDTPI